MPAISEWLGERGSREEAEHVRKGTRQQYESEWILVGANQSAEYVHDFGEIPTEVEVDYSLSRDGAQPQHANTSGELFHEFTYDPGSIANNDTEEKTVTVTGAALGDFVLVAAPYDLEEIFVTSYVSAADTVEIRLINMATGGAVDLASGTWAIRILKRRPAEVRKSDTNETKGSEEKTVTVTNNSNESRYFKVRAQ